MQQGGKILAQILTQVAAQVKPGANTKDLDALAERLIRQQGGFPAFKGYQGFPSALCTCINEEVVHAAAIPGRQLKEGDMLCLDLGMRYPAKNGLVVDTAVTVAVGRVSAQTKKLIAVTKKALALAIRKIKPGARLGDISATIQQYVEKNKFNVVRDLVGHGVGYKVHEDPQIPNYGLIQTGPVLEPGMTLAIEPMVTVGDYNVILGKDKRTYKTRDNSWAAHFEHTVVVTDKGYKILTTI